MSVVSGVILCMGVGEEEIEDSPVPVLERINAWLERHHQPPMKHVEDYFGGGKHPQMLVVAAGFNHLQEDDFAQFVLAQQWNEPERVVLIIQPEEGQTRVFRPSPPASNAQGDGMFSARVGALQDGDLTE